MTKEQVFRILLDKYIALVLTATDKATAMRLADDIREAWVSIYSQAAEQSGAQKSRHETKI